MRILRLMEDGRLGFGRVSKNTDWTIPPTKYGWAPDPQFGSRMVWVRVVTTCKMVVVNHFTILWNSLLLAE